MEMRGTLRLPVFSDALAGLSAAGSLVAAALVRDIDAGCELQQQLASRSCEL